MPNRTTICLGANTPDATARLGEAYKMLEKMGSIVTSTPLYPTNPEFTGDAAPYLNRIVIMETKLTYESLTSITKEYQTRVRNEADADPLVAVDIDIVVWNGTTIRPADAASAYFRKGIGLLQQRTQDTCDASASATGVGICKPV